MLCLYELLGEREREDMGCLTWEHQTMSLKEPVCLQGALWPRRGAIPLR